MDLCACTLDVGGLIAMSDIGRAVDAFMSLLMFSVVITWPLALWKMVDIIIWLFAHMRFAWEG